MRMSKREYQLISMHIKEDPIMILTENFFQN